MNCSISGVICESRMYRKRSIIEAQLAPESIPAGAKLDLVSAYALGIEREAHSNMVAPAACASSEPNLGLSQTTHARVWFRQNYEKEHSCSLSPGNTLGVFLRPNPQGVAPKGALHTRPRSDQLSNGLNFAGLFAHYAMALQAWLLKCSRQPAISNNMPLSDTAVLIFVLHRSGCVGRLTSGRIERDGPDGLNVYTGPGGCRNDYISGSNLRSWCVLGPDGKPISGWCEIAAEDRAKIFGR